MAAAVGFDARACGIPHPDNGGADADTWVLAFDEYAPAQEGKRESLCTLANGYWGMRGAAEDSIADGVHYPGTHFAGVYDVVDWTIDDVPAPDEEMVNAPNWLPFLHRRNVAFEDVQIGAADRRRLDLDDRVRRLLDPRIGHFLPDDRSRALVHQRSHVAP